MQIFLDTEQWGRLEITERVEGWEYVTRDGVGWETSSLDLGGSIIEQWPLLEHQAEDLVEFYDGTELHWRGFLSGAELNESNALALKAEGAGLRLRDVGVWRVFSDAGYGFWHPADDPPEGFTADNNNRVYVEGRGDFDDGDEHLVVYPETGLELGAAITRLVAHVELTITDGAWIAEIRQGDDVVLWTAAVDADEDVDLAVADDSLVVALRKDGAAAGEATVRLTQVVVQTLAGATNSQVVETILTDAGLSADVQESGLAVNRALWQEQSRLKAIQEMAYLGDGDETWRYVVYEIAQFGAWPDAVTWELQREDLSRWSITWRRDAVRNAVRARLPGGWLSDWYEDAASITRWGRREQVLSLPHTTQAEASRLAQIYLVEHASALAGLRLEVDAYCRTPDGARRSIWHVRSGDIVRLRDLIPDQDVTIRVAETRSSSSGMEIVPAGADDRLETILAAQEQSLRSEV